LHYEALGITAGTVAQGERVAGGGGHEEWGKYPYDGGLKIDNRYAQNEALLDFLTIVFRPADLGDYHEGAHCR
jgi:hypothetical protein